MSQFQQIKAFFDSYHLALSDEWLECCVNWCKAECLPSNYTQQDLQVKVYEQWLLLDLREVQVASLPRGLSTQKNYTLSGTYCLQMMQIIDISKPKLWQIQRIRNTVGKNTEAENDFGKRALQMTLTDGVQEIEAFEFKPISDININLVPGIKIKIMGPVTVRNGRLMLETHHVKILGGEVEEIRISNAAENVLARSLGLKENPNPFVIDESILTANMDILDASKHQGTQNISNPTKKPFQSIKNQNLNNANQHQETLTSFFNEKNTKNNNKHNVQYLKKASEENFEIDEDLLREFENDDFEEDILKYNISKNKNSGSNRDKLTNNVKSLKNCSSPDMFDNMEFDEDLLNEHLNQLDKSIEKDDFSNNKLYSEASKVSAKQKSNHPNKDAKDYCKIVTPSSVQNEESNEDFFNNSDLDAHLDQLDAEMNHLPSSTQRDKSNIETTPIKCDNSASSINPGAKSIDVVTPKSNVFTIEKLKKLQPNIGKGKFKISAVFKDVIEKMGVDEESKRYKLVICVKDEQDELLLNVDSDLVADWMELSADSLMNIKQLIYQNNIDAIKNFKTALTKLREKVMNLGGVLEVEITRGQKYPLLVAVLN